MALPRDNRDVAAAFDELLGHLDVKRVPRYGQDMFCMISRELQFSQAGVVENSWVRDALQLDRQQYGEGWHLCISGQPQAVWRRWRDPLLAGMQHEDKPMLLRYLNDPAYRTQQEQRIELYVPLAPGAARADLAHSLLG